MGKPAAPGLGDGEAPQSPRRAHTLPMPGARGGGAGWLKPPRLYLFWGQLWEVLTSPRGDRSSPRPCSLSLPVPLQQKLRTYTHDQPLHPGSEPEELKTRVPTETGTRAPPAGLFPQPHGGPTTVHWRRNGGHAKRAMERDAHQTQVPAPPLHAAPRKHAAEQTPDTDATHCVTSFQ